MLFKLVSDWLRKWSRNVNRILFPNVSNRVEGRFLERICNCNRLFISFFKKEKNIPTVEATKIQCINNNNLAPRNTADFLRS
jgi:hypothetical protein